MSCEKNPCTLPPAPSHPSQTVLQNISITQFSYDSFSVEADADFSLPDKSIDMVYLGTRLDSGFEVKSIAKPRYTPSGAGYRVSFKLVVTPPGDMVRYPFTIRYQFPDNEIADLDTTFDMCHYPYLSGEVFMLWDSLPAPFSPHPTVQDFDLSDPFFYYHPYGADGLYQRDMGTGETRSLLQYVGGDYIAADSQYVFADIEHTYIYRYNLAADSVDIQKKVIEDNDNDGIYGVELYQNHLFVLTGQRKLLEFDTDLNPVNTIIYNNFAFGLTIYNGIAYSSGNEGITRFVLADHTFLDPLPAPADQIDGIRIYHGYFYYTEVDRKFIGRVPLADFLPQK